MDWWTGGASYDGNIPQIGKRIGIRTRCTATDTTARKVATEVLEVIDPGSSLDAPAGG